MSRSLTELIQPDAFGKIAFKVKHNQIRNDKDKDKDKRKRGIPLIVIPLLR